VRRSARIGYALRCIANGSHSRYQLGRTNEVTVYICLCNALTDRDLQPHVAGGSNSLSMVYRACGCQPQCGKCVPFVRQMLREGAETSTIGQADGAD